MLKCQACGVEFEAGGRTGKPRDARFHDRRCAAAARWRTGTRATRLDSCSAAYLAGFLDGEGSIMLYRRGNGAAMRISISNTNRPVLEWCQRATSVGAIVVAPRSNPRHKTAMMWMVNSQPAASILEQVLPYLIVKHEQATVALEFQRKLAIPADKAQKEWQEQWRVRMKMLNARGSEAARA